MARRVGLTLNISHPRFTDLRIKLIAPSGRAVQLDPGVERSSSADRIRIPADQLAPIVGERLEGTWSVSIRDEATGIAGYLAGWTLTLNSQVLVEDFQRGIGIPDPVERETGQFWTSPDSRYAIARATQSDSIRLWDLSFGRPLATMPITQNETLIGIDGAARRLVTATLDTVNLWDVATGERTATLDTGPASGRAMLTSDGRHLVVLNRSDVETGIEWWRLDAAEKIGELTVAGVPALVALDATGRRVAVADYDRAVRVWDLESGNLVGQFDLSYQPRHIALSAGGDTLGAVYNVAGLSIWAVDSPQAPILEHIDPGNWQLVFSPSGARVIVGRPDSGYDVHASSNGRRIGPTIGVSGHDVSNPLVAFSGSEDVVATRGPDGTVRFWQMPVSTSDDAQRGAAHGIWTPAADSVVAAVPGANVLLIADRDGHVHRLPAESVGEALERARDDVSFIGHNAPVRKMTVSPDGRLVASIAADDTLRIWNTADGLPRPFIEDLPAGAVDRLAFSRDNRWLGLLGGSRVLVVNTETGDVDAEVALGEAHHDLAFGADGSIYLGSTSGALNRVTFDAPGGWTVQRLWQGDAPLRLLALSPRERFLVVVDENNDARQFQLADGRMGDAQLALPSAVEELSFSPDGSRVLFRTARWVHRAASSPAGLSWLQAIFAPRPLNASRIVFANDPDGASGRTFYLPVVGDGIVRLAAQRFDDYESQGLFGKRQELIAEWRRRLGRSAVAADTEAEAAGGN